MLSAVEGEVLMPVETLHQCFDDAYDRVERCTTFLHDGGPMARMRQASRRASEGRSREESSFGRTAEAPLAEGGLRLMR